jgi:hypothetical protein
VIHNDTTILRFALNPFPHLFSSHLMSCFLVQGLSGSQVCTAITKADGMSTGIWHVHYDTALTCQDPPLLPAELRNYSPINDTVFQDDTVAFVMAKAYVPPGNVVGNILLEAIHIAPLLGDPSDDSYDEHMPDFPYPIVFGLGTVTSSVETFSGSRISFPVSLSNYVRGNLKQSILQSVPLSLS